MGSASSIGSAVGAIAGSAGGPAGASAGSSIGGAIGGAVDQHQDQNKEKIAKNDDQARTDDTSMRDEATYRANHAQLQSAISDYYKKQGWALPTETDPGAYTTRPLPGDAPLYPGYNIPGSTFDHTAVAPASAATSTGDPVADSAAAGAPIANTQVGSGTVDAPGSSIVQVAKPAVYNPQDVMLVNRLGAQRGF